MGIEKVYENLKGRVLEKSRSDKTKKAILEIDRELKLDGRKLNTRRNFLQRVNLLLEWWGKPIEKMTREDSLAFLEYMKDRGMALTSIEMHKQSMNVIQTYAFGKEPDWLADKKRNRKNRMFNIKRVKTAVKKDILNSEDIRKMVEYSKSIRNKAIVMALWESGTRVNCEFLQMRIRDLTFDQYGCIAVVGDPQESKTGQRTLRLLDSSTFIESWIKEHPNPRLENYLWVSGRDYKYFDPRTKKWVNMKKGKALTFQAVTRIVKDLGKFVGKSNISPKDFRSGRATELASELTSFELCSFMGWELDSSMPRVYINRSGLNVDRKLLANRGIVQKNGENGNGNHLETRLCPLCKKPNLTTSRFCYACGNYLQGHIKENKEEMLAKDFMNFVMDDPEASKHMENMMKLYVRKKQTGEEKNL